MLTEYSIRPLTAAEATGPLLDALTSVFAAALGFARTDRRARDQTAITQRHAARGGFRAFGAFDRDQLVGFTYGYTSQPGLWWRVQVESALTPAQIERWFSDAFELCELHVHPAHQGRHLGSRLHDAVVDGLPHHTALLSVMHRSARARQLYASRHWQPVVPELRFSSDPATPFSVLGLAL